MLHHTVRTLDLTKETQASPLATRRRARQWRERNDGVEARRKPLAKLEGRRRMPLSGLTIAWGARPVWTTGPPTSRRRNPGSSSWPIAS